VTAALQWYGEQFPPHGALAAEGFGKLLGRPSLDPLTVLIRETAQNSWDARLPRATVRFSMDGFTLDDDQWNALAYEVYGEVPQDGLPLIWEAFEKESLDVLVISDRGTRGLGGPTRADQPTDGPTDYVDLLMNVGVGGHELGGGTYGFGKTIAYVVSNARTIVVHSRTSNGLAKPQTRLIASAIGDEFVRSRKRYTGRHWWGREKGGAPEPLTGRTAEKLARAIGFPGFDDDETGTSIMVVDPNFGDRDQCDAMSFLADAITWNLWPKIVRHRGRIPMSFSVTWNGEQVPVAHPDDVPPLHGFAQALEAVRAHDEPFKREDGLELIEIRAQRPNRRLGKLALYTFVTKPRPLPRRAPDGDEGEEEFEPLNAAAFTGNAHHVALMRAPELVVRYVAGPELPDTTVEWGGVFICDRDLDPAFAASEPPTHDDWQPLLVAEKRDRRVVSVALREIRDAARSRIGTAQGTVRAGTASVARIADALSGLVGGVPGTGSGRGPRPGGAGTSARPRRPVITDPRCAPVLVGGARLTRLDFGLTVPTAGPVRIELRAGVATNDGTGIESDPPAGSPVPELVRVVGPVTVTVDGQAAEFDVQVPKTSEWTVLATSPDEVMVAFDVHVVPAEREPA
jgi:hypothetical protein